MKKLWTNLEKSSFWFWIAFALLFLSLLIHAVFKKEPDTLLKTGMESTLPLVSVQSFSGLKNSKPLEFYGTTEASKTVALKAQTQGILSVVVAKDGAIVPKNGLIMQISAENRVFDLEQAQARLAQCHRDFKAAQALAQKSFQALSQVAKTQADLKEAEARENALKLDLERTKIKAPFEGVFVKALLHEGAFLQPDTVVGTFVALNPLHVTVFVCEKEYHLLNLGAGAQIILSDGKPYASSLTYKSALSQGKTHTFELRFELENADQAIPAGVSAKILVPQNLHNHTLLPSSVMVIDSKGTVGVRVVNSLNQVEFVPINIVAHEHDGVLVSDFPAYVNVITKGQEIVTEGQKVRFVNENPASHESPISQKDG